MASKTIQSSCAFCLTPFKAFDRDVRLGMGRYCSRSCFYQARTRPITERFWEKVQICSHGFNCKNCCWIWQAAKTPDGYGRFQVKNKACKAPRIAYILIYGKIPHDMTIDHICYQPSCVNPSHLDICSIGENVRRACRHRQKPTHCKRGHPFESWNLMPRKDGRRRCRLCSRIAENQRNHIKRMINH